MAEKTPAPNPSGTPTPAPTHRVDLAQAAWHVNTSYPDALRAMVRWKTLIGGNGNDWVGGVPQQDVAMGVLELDPGGYYPAHAHPAPEIYFVTAGSAQWTVGDDTFLATPGMAIYHAPHTPHTPHRMVNHGTDKLEAVWFWWAPDGRRDVLAGEVALLEQMPQNKG